MLGYGDLPRPQICAVDMPLRLLVGAQLSAQTNQIARKYGPLENAIWLFSGFWSKSTFSENPTLEPFPGLYTLENDLKLLQIDKNTNLGLGNFLKKIFIFRDFDPLWPALIGKKG